MAHKLRKRAILVRAENGVYLADHKLINERLVAGVDGSSDFTCVFDMVTSQGICATGTPLTWPNHRSLCIDGVYLMTSGEARKAFSWAAPLSAAVVLWHARYFVCVRGSAIEVVRSSSGDLVARLEVGEGSAVELIGATNAGLVLVAVNGGIAALVC